MDHILGQSRAIEVLRRQFATGRLHHAFIFHGPAGVGKFTTAAALAKVLLCHGRSQDSDGGHTACGACESCRLADIVPPKEDKDDESALGVAHPDLHIITKELARYHDDAKIRNAKMRNIPLDVVKQALLVPAHRSAQLGGGRYGKVFIVDEAELLNFEGQNVLLKTLEEPPISPGGGATTIILVTSSEDRLLPTIRSRCQRVAFVPLPDDAVRTWIEGQAGAPQEPRQVNWVVRFAGGSIGRASLALEYGLMEWAQVILPAMREMAKGKAVGDLGGKLAGMIGQFADDWVSKHKNASKEAANQQAAALCFAVIATEAQHQLAGMAARCDPADPVGADALTGPWLAVIDAVDQAQRYIATNVHLGLACDHLALSMNEALAGEGSRA